MSSYTRECRTTLVHDVNMMILTSWHHFHVGSIRRQRIRGKPNWKFLDRNCSYFSVKLIQQHIFKSRCSCQKKSMQEKESIMVVRCKLKILSLGITVQHHSPNLVMPNSYLCDGIFNQHLTAIKDYYILQQLKGNQLSICLLYPQAYMPRCI